MNTCPVCKGRGRWQAMVEVQDPTTPDLTIMALQAMFCESCMGTGIPLDEGGESYDIAGESVIDDD